MNLDIRYPIGLLFLIIGVILAACGIFIAPEAGTRLSLGSNVNLFWGLIQIVFGAIMIALARSGARKKDGKP